MLCLGQRIWSAGNGIVPEEREDGLQYEVKAFDALYQSISSYIHNLNSHKAYEGLRFERTSLKKRKWICQWLRLKRHSSILLGTRGRLYRRPSCLDAGETNFVSLKRPKLIPEQVAQIFQLIQ